MDAEVIVVGGGVVGLWTANYLAQQGVKTILFEQFPYPHTRGSSHGQSRIIRTAYEIEEYSAMMEESYRKWKGLETISGKRLLINSPLVCTYNMEEASSQFDAVMKRMEKYQPNHRVIEGEDLNKEFPGFVGKTEWKAICDEGAGILKADSCLEALRARLAAQGGDIHDAEEVVSIRPISDSEVEVKSRNRTYRARSVVLTCGPFINRILSSVDLQIPVKLKKATVLYWRDESRNGIYSQQNKFPCITLHSKFGYFYSIPSYEYPGLMKICYHSVDIAIDPVSRDEANEYLQEMEKYRLEQLEETISVHFPYIDTSSPAIRETCIYTDSPDSDFILDFHPEYRNVVIGGGFSGHGFKTSPAVGHILANMAVGLKTPYPVGPFSLNRFKKTSNL